jgi:elongation factor P--beta-lysine ligase
MAQPDKLPGPLTPPLRRERISYVEAFKTAFGIDPLVVPLEELRALARSAGLVTRPSQDSPPSMSPQHSTGSPGSPVNSPGALADSASAPINTPADALAERDELLEFLMGVKIGPTLGRNALTFIHRYPASQAALARLDPHDPRVALRFELYCEGIELANGFHELASPGEQRARFEHDLAERRRRGLAADRMDELLLRALEAGLPECAGVAVGFDRLLMLATGANHIDAVLPFPIERA